MVYNILAKPCHASLGQCQTDRVVSNEYFQVFYWLQIFSLEECWLTWRENSEIRRSYIIHYASVHLKSNKARWRHTNLPYLRIWRSEKLHELVKHVSFHLIEVIWYENQPPLIPLAFWYRSNWEVKKLDFCSLLAASENACQGIRQFIAQGRSEINKSFVYMRNKTWKKKLLFGYRFYNIFMVGSLSASWLVSSHSLRYSSRFVLSQCLHWSCTFTIFIIWSIERSSNTILAYYILVSDCKKKSSQSSSIKNALDWNVNRKPSIQI